MKLGRVPGRGSGWRPRGITASERGPHCPWASRIHCRSALYPHLPLSPTPSSGPQGRDGEGDLQAGHPLSRQPKFLLLFSRSVVSDSLQPHGLQHTRFPCPSPTPRICSNSCPSSQRCHPTISSSVIPFTSRLQSLPASGSFPMSQLFTSGRQSIGASASTSFPPKKSQG